jgi:transposase-like protein
VSRGKYYTPEFKEQAAKKVVEGSLKVAQVARELDVNETTLGCWVSLDFRSFTVSSLGLG